MSVARRVEKPTGVSGAAVPPCSENICAVVVTYHPDAGLGPRLESIAAQVAGVVVVDNSADDAAKPMLRAVADRVGAHLVLNAENLGVAAAVNLGTRWAVGHGHRWVLTIDQDSVPSPALVDGLVDAYHACDFRDLIGAIGSNWVNATTSTVNLGTSRFRGRTWRECKTVINSGTLFSLSAYAGAGPFRDDFFIDSVDHEYCLRLRANGYRVIVTREALMVHPLGDYRHVRLLGMGVAHSDHPSLRKYFQTRNRLVLISEYALKEPLWALGQARRMIQDSVLMLCCERSRRRKIAAMALGAQHFLRGRTGPLNARELRRINS